MPSGAKSVANAALPSAVAISTYLSATSRGLRHRVQFDRAANQEREMDGHLRWRR